MINIFRKMRKRLAEENKFERYMRYAVGEVLLIVIGIFFALQLQNWNENRKKEKQFKAEVEQLYNSIKYDAEIFRLQRERLVEQIIEIDTLLNYPEKRHKSSIPSDLIWFGFESLDDYISETNYHLTKLTFNPENLEQNELAKQITRYVNSINQKTGIDNDELWEFIEEKEIPFRGPFLGEDSVYIYVHDSIFYSKDEIERVSTLLRTHKLRTILKTVQAGKLYLRIYASNRYDDAISIMQLIKTYYPETRLLYQDVGIIGGAIEGYIGTKSKPLTLTSFNKSIWEIDIYLKEGSVKFRCRDSWNENWGGASFPKGKAEHDGSNIRVEQGFYHVILNLSENTYEFIKKEE